MGVVESTRNPRTLLWGMGENNLEVITSISQDTGLDLVSKSKPVSCEIDVITSRLQAHSDRLPSASENVQKSPKGRQGRQRRRPQRYGEWV